MPRLRRSDPARPGWTRRRAGRGFSYRDQHGDPLPADELARVKALAIPPAWQEVWICPWPNGHLQAVGTDAAGRRQYLYHPAWRERRDQEKFARVLTAGAQMPAARRRVAADLDQPGMPLTRACAVTVRLLDLGYFRIGNDAYTDAHGSFGLTTLRRDHVRKHGQALLFSFVGKSGIAHRIEIADPPVLAALALMRRRRDGGERLLAFRDEAGSWCELGGPAVNAYLAELFAGAAEGAFTAKDFRTWHATVIAAEQLALAGPVPKTAGARRKVVKRAVSEVAAYLGNTPTVARNSYVDPRVIDLFTAGSTIAAAAGRQYPDAAVRQEALEAAVLELLG